jgi:hypothetical protein
MQKRSFRPSPKSDVDKHHIAAGPSSPVNSLGTHNLDSGSHPASVTATDTRGTPALSQSKGRIPSSFADNLPAPHTRYWGLVSQADTHPSGFRLVAGHLAIRV